MRVKAFLPIIFVRYALILLTISSLSTHKSVLFPLSEDLRSLAAIFHKSGFSLYVVGGAIRDFLLGRTCDDVDLATDATVENVLRLFPRSLKTGIRHGTLTIPFRRKHYECTTFRTDGDYEDFRHPKSVGFVKDIQEDLKRRDFTINALCANCADGRIVDEFEGETDIKNRLIRTVGDPVKRFSEDALRLIRAVRFASTLDFQIEDETFSAISRLSFSISKVSKERVCSELCKIIASDGAGKGIKTLFESGLLPFILPALSKRLASFDNLGLVVKRLDARPVRHVLEVRLALLYSLPCVSDERNRGQDVPVLDGDLALCEEELKNIRLSNGAIRLTLALLRSRVGGDRSDADLKRALRQAGKANLQEFLDFNRMLLEDEDFSGVDARVRAFIASKEPVDLSDLCITGEDVIGIGLSGKAVGQALERALEMTYENPSLNRNAGELLSLSCLFSPFK